MRRPRSRFRQWLLSAKLPVIAALAFAVPLGAEEKPSIVATVIRAGKLFDPASGRLLDSPGVLISGNNIEAVGSRDLATPAKARMIDLGSATLLPGFIDVHTHLTFDAGGGGYESLGISTPRAALTGAKNARLTLLAGFKCPECRGRRLRRCRPA